MSISGLLNDNDYDIHLSKINGSIGSLNEILKVGVSGNPEYATNDSLTNAAGTATVHLSSDDDIILKGHIDMVHDTIISDTDSLQIQTSVNGFANTKAIDMLYTTGAIPDGSAEAVCSVSIDETLCGDITIAAFLALSTNASPSTVYGLLCGPSINPILNLSGVTGNFDEVLVDGVDETVALSDGGLGQIPTFVNDNDTLIVASTTTFNQIQVILDVSASIDVVLVCEFSLGGDIWQTFVPTDGTNGFTSSSLIIWLDGIVPGWALDGGFYKIRLTRTKNNVATVPVSRLIKQLSQANRFEWDSGGNLTINTLVMEPMAVHVPPVPRQMTFATPDDSTLVISLKGIDNVVRTGTINLV